MPPIRALVHSPAVAAVVCLSSAPASAQESYDPYYDPYLPPAADVPPPPMPPRQKLQDTFQLIGKVGYLFGANVGTPVGDLGFNGGVAYGAALAWRLPAGFFLQGDWTWLPTELTITDPFAGKTRLAGMDVQYFQLGVLKDLVDGPVRPYLGVSVGATLFNPHSRFDDEWRFGGSLFGGLKLFPSEYLGLQLQARLVSTFAGSNSGVFCSFGGCSFGVAGDGILQTELTGALVVPF